MCQCDPSTDNSTCDCEDHDEACGCGEGDGACDCHSGLHLERRFQTKAEQIAELEGYLTELKTEVQAVEEHLADLRR